MSHTFLLWNRGFRYELFCVSRSHSTPTVTIWANTGMKKARARLEQKQKMGPDGTRIKDDVPAVLLASNTVDAKFPVSMFDDFCNRFEPPNEQNKWDRPLFVIDDPDDDGTNDYFVIDSDCSFIIVLL